MYTRNAASRYFSKVAPRDPCQRASQRHAVITTVAAAAAMHGSADTRHGTLKRPIQVPTTDKIIKSTVCAVSCAVDRLARGVVFMSGSPRASIQVFATQERF